MITQGKSYQWSVSVHLGNGDHGFFICLTLPLILQKDLNALCPLWDSLLIPLLAKFLISSCFQLKNLLFKLLNRRLLLFWFFLIKINLFSFINWIVYLYQRVSSCDLLDGAHLFLAFTHLYWWVYNTNRFTLFFNSDVQGVLKISGRAQEINRTPSLQFSSWKSDDSDVSKNILTRSCFRHRKTFTFPTGK